MGDDPEPASTRHPAARGSDQWRAEVANYRQLLDSLPDIVARYDRHGRMLYVNGNIAKTTGRPPEHFIGRLHGELGYDAQQVAFWEGAIARVFASGRPRDEEFTIDGPNGRFVLEWRLLPERNVAGQVVSVLGIARDVSRERQAEQNYRQLFAAMLDGFALHEIICDQAGEPVDYRFLIVNPAFEKLTGLRAEEIVGRRVLEVLPNTERSWIERFGRVALGGEAQRFDDYSQELGRHYQVVAYRPSRGRFATIVQDVTLEKAYEQQQRQTAKMEALGNLAGGIAHDFNNILQAILGYGHLALRDAEPDSRQDGALRAIMESSQRAAELVRGILAFSRQDEQSVREVDLAAVVAEVLRLLRSTVPASIDLDSDLAADCPPVLADPSALHQVIMNLMTNAVYAMRGRPGRLQVRLRRKRKRLEPDGERIDCVQLRVRDEGCGMDADTCERATEPFFTTKPQGEGTGIGLSVVHGIVSRYGGRIAFDSRPGEGTTVRILLPVVAFDATDGDGSSGVRHDLQAIIGEARLLFVDDEPMLVELAAEFLAELGCRVVSCCRPAEALAHIEAEPEAWSLLISDQTMPGMSGLELARRAKRLRGDLPVMLCTGYSEELEGDPHELGFDELLRKPYELDELVRRVKRWLRPLGP